MARATTLKKDISDTWDGASLEDGGLSGLLGYHLRMASVSLYRDYMAAMAELDLTQKQAATLTLIHANPGAPQVAIANKLGADRATIMAMIDRLEARGFITRERSATDRRRQELYLTPLGEETLTEARKRIAMHEQRFVAHLTAAERKSLMAILKRLHAYG